MYGIGGAERLPHGLPSRKINRIYIDLAMSRSKIKMSEHTTCFLLEHYSLVAPLRVCHGWSRSSPPAASPRRPSTRPSTTPTSRGEARAQAEAQGRGGGNRLNALETQLVARCTCCNRVCKRGDRRVLKTYRTGASTKPLAPAPNHWRHFPRSLALHSRFSALSYCYCSHQKGKPLASEINKPHDMRAHPVKMQLVLWPRGSTSSARMPRQGRGAQRDGPRAPRREAAWREALVTHEPAVRHHPQPHVLGAFPRIAAHRALVYARLLLARNLSILSERTWSRAMVTRCAMIAPRSSASTITEPSLRS